MKNVISHEKYGKISYEESFWTGKKSISIDGKNLVKTSKNSFKTEDEQTVVVLGNYLSGVKVTINSEAVQVTPPLTWYESVFSLIPFVFILIWGNVVALCAIVPVVGGLIGGAISGMFSMLNLFVIKGINKVWLKALISIATLALTFLSCYLVALLII